MSQSDIIICTIFVTYWIAIYGILQNTNSDNIDLIWYLTCIWLATIIISQMEIGKVLSKTKWSNNLLQLLDLQQSPLLISLCLFGHFDRNFSLTKYTLIGWIWWQICKYLTNSYLTSNNNNGNNKSIESIKQIKSINNKEIITNDIKNSAMTPDLQLQDNSDFSNLNSKRMDYLKWDEYFMFISLLSSMRSKDPNTQVGACIVNSDKKIVGIGYNGFPWNCNDDKLPWQRKDEINNDINNTKYPYVCHAEMNAILNKNESSLKDCTMYVVLFPCNECAKLIIQSRIEKIIYYYDKYKDSKNVIASKKMLDMAGIKYIQFKPQRYSVCLQFPQIVETQ